MKGRESKSKGGAEYHEPKKMKLEDLPSILSNLDLFVKAGASQHFLYKILVSKLRIIYW